MEKTVMSFSIKVAMAVAWVAFLLPICIAVFYYNNLIAHGYKMYRQKRYRRAIISFNKVLRWTPFSMNIWYFRSKALLKLGHYKEAIQSCNMALKYKQLDIAKTMSDRIWHQKGKVLYLIGDYEDAMRNFDNIIQHRMHSHKLWLYLIQPLTSKPILPKAFYSKALCHAALGNIDLAVENLQQAIQFGSEEYQEKAIAESAFDPIRQDSRFQIAIADY
jgi:tetratricopeptide (TPR) repeat protein